MSVLKSLRLLPRLIRADYRAGGGRLWLEVLAVVSHAVCALMALTVISGLQMFFGRYLYPTADLLGAMSLDASYLQDLRYDASGTLIQSGLGPAGEYVVSEYHNFYAVYMMMAGFATALMFFPILNLGAGAARLGAYYRERRLASLRLLGASNAQVSILTLAQSLVQVTLGIILATVAWRASLPLWSAYVDFNAVPIGPQEMLLSPGGYLAVVVGLYTLTVLSSLYGLAQVSISPLGVVKRQSRAALRWWRLAVAVVLLVAYLIGSRMVSLDNYASTGVVVLGIAAALIGAANLVFPLLLQVVARIAAHTRHPARLLAARRIVADPKGAWRLVSGIGMVSLVTVLASVAVTVMRLSAADRSSAIMGKDIFVGALITMAITLVVGCLMAITQQATRVIEMAGQERALEQMGMPPAVLRWARWHQLLLPLCFAIGGSVLLGLSMSLPMAVVVSVDSLLITLVVVGAALGVTLLAALACEPLARRLAAEQSRRND